MQSFPLCYQNFANNREGTLLCILCFEVLTFGEMSNFDWLTNACKWTSFAEMAKKKELPCYGLNDAMEFQYMTAS